MRMYKLKMYKLLLGLILLQLSLNYLGEQKLLLILLTGSSSMTYFPLPKWRLSLYLKLLHPLRTNSSHTSQWTASRFFTTTMVITFWDLLIFYQIFLSPQVKWSVIISNKHGTSKLPHKLPKNFRLRDLGN